MKQQTTRSYNKIVYFVNQLRSFGTFFTVVASIDLRQQFLPKHLEIH